MEYRDAFGSAGIILDGLLRQIGLFPYLDPAHLSLADFLAYEAHRPERLGDDIVFHRAQAHVYQLLMAGENIALSAPTSFGKSLVIDAVIASGKYKNIVIVVPTLALIDETRRRLTERFRGEFKIITHPSQERAEKNLYVLTQERVLERDDWTDIDFFVIDEFYKLAPQRGDNERSAALNHAFYKLVKTGAQFYMLGPNISGITDQNHLRIELRFIKEPHFHTVATHVHRLRLEADEFETLTELCRTLDEPTIIFCSSPARASEVARRLVAAGLGSDNERLRAAADWISATYHVEWHFGKALARGIGIHHGRIPRSLAQFAVRRFNEGDIRFLACTSTLIEGVNTRARNIIVFDNRINREEIDLFTFNNIKGRSGRMFQYFVGHVYVYPARLPSIYRADADQRELHSIRYFGVASDLWDLVVRRKVSISYGIPFYSQRFFGDYDLCGWAEGDPSTTQIHWQIIGLLQHYGYTTPCLDVTSSPLTALFFACYDAKTNTILRDGIGYIYSWKRHAICSNACLASHVNVRTLSILAGFINRENISPTSRPESQDAGVMQIGRGTEPEELIQWWLSHLEKAAAIYAIDRTHVPDELLCVQDYYPRDAIPDLLSQVEEFWVARIEDALSEGLISDNGIESFKKAVRMSKRH